ncbi:hypothetical protein [Altererythrobacter sp. GH1-8]|uniref:hypothetical protein n=1 Tax=Altererythrobacter sp. GH1-8 TaxID=3349333 RepID=UPI00374CCCB9
MSILHSIITPLLFAAAPKGDTPIELNGFCQYTEWVQQRADEATVLLDCSRFVLDQSGSSAGFEFGQRGWKSKTRFEGQLVGEQLDVTALVLSNGSRLEARGECEIFRTNGKVSVVSCLAEAKAVWYVANFKVSLISH